ncbi:pectinesterase family protein [Uliginosibacterium sp. H3]|uniref:Pectinesterase n=1 Tax=Uliginosibacterium silvisoli TaxID=3114758 RepID=A0ABU6K0M5_9RHOO|nr:pectinesterase family protein [Uliginosibacterium sp. H3]
MFENRSACRSALLVSLLTPLLFACASGPYPSTPTRPQLTAAEAARYSYAEVLKTTGTVGAMTTDPWDPLADTCMSAGKCGTDYTVDKAAAASATVLNTIQAAVNKAVIDATAAKRTSRIYIRVMPGTYNELVYVPALAAPITLYSTEADASKTRIAANIDAGMPGDEFTAKFGAQFKDVDASIAAMAKVQLDKGKSSIGTSGSAMVWIKNDGFQAKNITFEDTYNEDRGCKEKANDKGQCPSGNHQAVAFLIDAADKVQVENGRFISNQDTLYFKSSAVGKTNRSFYNNSYVEGDVDFIFGRATAFFRNTEIKSLGGRSSSVFATAPSTNVGTPYGIVFDNCDFTSDGLGVATTAETYLGRQWFESQRCSPYGDAKATCVIDAANTGTESATLLRKSTLETVGKVVVMNSRIGKHINKSPWADWESSPAKSNFRKATFSSDTFFDNLQAAGKDPAALGYKKKVPAEPFLAEFNNTGAGASPN